MPDAPLPIQPVRNPILCSPYAEPDRHWLYDTKTGRPSEIPTRREASYWFKTERSGSAQRSLLAEEERDDLPEPDFIVRLANGVHVVVEVKGRPDPDTDAKHQAAKRWISAVNHWGQLGEWDFLVCRNPQSLAREITALIETRRSHLRNLAAKIRAEAEDDVHRLRSEGWERADFARALRDLFDSDGQSPG